MKKWVNSVYFQGMWAMKPKKKWVFLKKAVD